MENNLKRLRNRRRMTLEQLSGHCRAHGLPVSVPTINRIERGTRVPRLDQYEVLRRALPGLRFKLERQSPTEDRA